ncbi:hypothetical protein BJX68DRAFT_244873 [Aspergillus pseudodeflectus]|uniref:Uncharacterized protein n=1 Tax=Aspergillus pseudodeflectus TaxID=176178 RepID=A0ABR4JQJ5_9EURO
MDDEIDNYAANLSRLSQILPGYDQLCETSTGQVRIDLIDVPLTGDVHVHDSQTWAASSIKADLFLWLTEQASETEVRYILVEDLIPEICTTLGAAFDLDPQFFIDHLSDRAREHVSRNTPRNGSLLKGRRSEWNAWNLHRPYISFRWYRPVAYEEFRGRHLRDQTETRAMDKQEVRPTRRGEERTYVIRKFSPASNILRSELDLSELVIPGFRSGEISAIEERVSIYQVTRNGRRYTIILSDAIPECRKTFWSTTDPDARPDAIPLSAHITTIPIYKCLVPRFAPGITSSRSIAGLPDNALASLYKSLASTESFLRAHAEHPIEKDLSLERRLFQIVVSDTLGLLHLLRDMRGNTARATASGTVPLEDILSMRTFIANLESHLSDLSPELAHDLRALLDLFPSETAHQTAVLRVETRFQRIVQDLTESLESIAGAVQFMESQRAIMEAESISRLTELAFLFIPLSFAAALFSMQVRELSQPPPVAYFVAFALSLSVTTYALRALARSSWVQQKKQRELANARRYYSLPPGARVGNRAMLAWMLPGPLEIIGLLLSIRIFAQILTEHYSLTLFTVAISLTCMLVPSLAVLWTRELATGLKIGVTFAIILCSGCVVLLVLLAAPATRVRIRRFFPAWSAPRVQESTSSNESTSTD